MRRLLASLILVALPCLAAAEDLTIVSTVTSARGDVRTAVQYLTSGRIRASDGVTDVVLDAASGRITIVNNRRKEYSQTSLDEVRAFRSQLDAAMEGNPLMEKMLGRMSGVSVLKGQARRTVAGYDAEQYTLSAGESVRLEVWAAPALEAPPAYFEARGLIYAAMGPMGRRLERVFDEMKDIKGLPLAVSSWRKTRMGEFETTTEATEVRRAPVPDSAFAVPGDYKKVESPFSRRG